MAKLCAYMFVLVVGFNSCTADTGPELAPVFVVDNYNTQPISDVSEYFELRNIILSDSVHRAVGGQIGEVFVDESSETAIFVDYGLGRVTALSYPGKIRWQLKPDGIAPYTFRQISLADFDRTTHELRIFDRSSRKIYYYTADGTFIRELSNRVDFLDIAYARDTTLIYYTEDFANYHITNDTVAYRMIIEHPDGHLSKVGRMSERHKFGFFEDKNEFNTYDEKIFLQRQFTDTIFEIVDDQMELSSLIRFAQGNRTQVILDDIGRENPYDDMREEGAPY